MAEANTIRGDQILIKVGDGADPEVFTADCLINTTRSLEFSAEGNRVAIPDCAALSDPNWTKFIKSELSATVSGAGVLHLPNVQDYFDWLKSPDPKNVQIEVGILSDTLGGYFTGPFQCTSFTPADGEKGNLANCSIGLESDGEITFVPYT